MKTLLLASVAAAALVTIGSTTPAHASLIGDSFTATYNYATAEDVHDGPYGPTVATGSNPIFQIEQDLGSPGIVNINIMATQISFTFNFSGSWAAASFNGVELTNLSNNFPVLTLDGSTNMPGFVASNLSVSGNILFVNWQGLSFDPTFQVVINAVDAPEPASLTLLAAGLAGLGLTRRRKAA